MASKRAMVTGATGGIGREFALHLAKEGWAVTLVARGAGALEQLRGGLSGAGHQILAADLGTDAGLTAVADRLSAEHHTVLVNNAGFGLYGWFTGIPVSKQRDMIRLNCESLTTLAYSFLSAAQPGDTLLNTASTLGFTPFPSSAVYAATKAYVISFSEALWYEQRPRGVNVIALCPGATRTPFHTQAGASDAAPYPPMMFQDPEDVVRTGLRAINGRRSGAQISGLLNAALVQSSRLLPRTWIVRIMGVFAPKTALETTTTSGSAPG